MKNALAILTLIICACSIPTSESERDGLQISVRLTTGERSRDSSSQTTTITVERDEIVWTSGTSDGFRTRPAPERKEFKLSPADKERLVKLIRSNNLLVTDRIYLPQDAPGFYFSVSVDLTLGKKQVGINISAPRNAVKVKEEKLYQNTLTLVTELYRIMNRQDKSVPVCATFFC